MTNSHGYVLEYPRIRVDHFDQSPVPVPPSILAHRRSVSKGNLQNGSESDSLPFAPNQIHFDKPLLYLLTHIHTDHLKGLDRPGITAPIYCSHATKQLLLKYERQKTRIEKDRDGVSTKHVGVVRPYAHLRVSDIHANAKAKLSGYQSTSLDLLQPLPYNVPTKVQYTPKSSVVLTLIESNHMMGGCMFLIQGSEGPVLHTGDMRAEGWWCDALTRNPYLSPYLCWSGKANQEGHTGTDNWADHIESFGSSSSSLPTDESQSQSQLDSPSQLDSQHNPLRTTSTSTISPRDPARRSQLRLRNIYLDTELLLCPQLPPSKQQACLDIITLLRLYPPSTLFFLNCWTWGYEDLLIYTAKAFGCKIHVDRFKYIMYRASKSELPFLADIVTQDGSKTRFHACEKRNTCSAVSNLASRYAAGGGMAKEAIAAHSQIDSCSDDAKTRWGPARSQPEPLLVYVNPGQISADRWQVMFRDTKKRLEAAGRGETAWPEALVVPIERHSTLPELQMFVGLFRPKTVSPNTILDPKGGLDYYLLHHLFGHLLAGAQDRCKLADQGLLMLGNKTWSFYETQLARAREQAQIRRANGGGMVDSTEAIRATSASLNSGGHSGESVGESLDVDQLEKLSKLRGISFKGLMMQNMAGNLAAMLEIERWRRAAGIEEELEGLEEVLEETQRSGDASVKSIDYDADCSQAETQVLRRRNETAASRAESSHQGAYHASSHGAAEQIVDNSVAVEVEAAQEGTQASQLAEEEEEEEEGAIELTEDLASRYLSVLIHHFSVPFNRTNDSYVQMWKSVRRKMPIDAQKVEEHWFRETGVLPPLWESQVITMTVLPPEPEVLVEQTDSRGGDGGVFGEILVSFIDMLEPETFEDGGVEGLVDVSTEHDRSIALQLILRHFAKIGFQNRLAAESSSEGHTTEGQSHGSCVGDAQEWRTLAAPLTELTRRLTAILRDVSVSAGSTKAEVETIMLALQVTGVLLSYRPLNAVIDRNTMQSLLERVVAIIEAPLIEGGDKSRRRIVALASAVLRGEELDEEVLRPFESRLLALVQDPDGPSRRVESFVDTETGLSEGISQPAAPEQHSPRIAAITTEQRTVEVVEESIDVEADASSLQIRAPRAASILPQALPSNPVSVAIASSRIAPLPIISDLSEEPLEQDSIVGSQQEEADDTIESATALLVEASQASSATQEEDSTQSEEAFTQSQVGSLPPPITRTVAAELKKTEDGRRVIGRTTSLPTFGRGEETGKAATKRKNDSTRAEARDRPVRSTRTRRT